MDLLSKWNQRIHDEPFSPVRSQRMPVASLVQNLLKRYTDLWWSSSRIMPTFAAACLPKVQDANEKQLGKMTDGLMYELKRMPANPEDRQAWQERLRPGMTEFARTALNLEQQHIDFVESSGMIEAQLEFSRMARRFDAKISADDIFQAGRNVMTMNFMQLLMGLPVAVTPSVFAYSMLYPYTDNYLDDPAVSRTTKLAFNSRFQRRLQGEKVRPANAHEETIGNLVEMIEDQWERAHYPQVYESLLAIHAAQARSLALVVPGASPFELDVLGISFEKGATSVLADGYLIAGDLPPEQADFMFGYGAFTQLMDDLEDIEQDMREGRMTIFSQTANHWPLDAITSQMIHFGRAIFGDLSIFPTEAASSMESFIGRSMDPVLIDIIGRTEKYYSKAYLREMEHHMPFHFTSLRKQRGKLTRQKIKMGSLIEAMM